MARVTPLSTVTADSPLATDDTETSSNDGSASGAYGYVLQKSNSFLELFNLNCQTTTQRYPVLCPIFAVFLVVLFYSLSVDQRLDAAMPAGGSQETSWTTLGRTAWSAFTCLFVHADDTHLWVNVGGLLFSGCYTEMRYGWHRWLFVLLSGGYAASWVFFLWAQDTKQSLSHLVGISGGIACMAGLLIADAVLNWPQLPYRTMRVASIAATTVIVFLQYLVPSANPDDDDNVRVAFVAHVAGFVFGAVPGMLYVPNYERKGWEIVVVGFAFVAWLFFIFGLPLWAIILHVS